MRRCCTKTKGDQVLILMSAALGLDNFLDNVCRIRLCNHIGFIGSKDFSYNGGFGVIRSRLN